MTAPARDGDPRNQLGLLPAEYEARCADGGVVFACLRTAPGQDTPFLVTAARPLAAVACEALPAAGALLALREPVREPVRARVEPTGANVAHLCTS